MKRFHFSLQAVAKMRVWRESQAREALAVAVRAYVEAEARLIDLRRAAAELEDIVRRASAQHFRASEQASFLHAYGIAANAIIEGERSVAEAQAALDGARNEWREARAAVKAVEALEKRARERHRLELGREEQRMLDERAAAVHAQAGGLYS